MFGVLMSNTNQLPSWRGHKSDPDGPYDDLTINLGILTFINAR